MPRKNKVHMSVIQVQELNENKIRSESPTPLEELNTEIPRTTGTRGYLMESGFGLGRVMLSVANAGFG